MNLSRRGLLGGLGLILAAPAIVKVESLMRISTPAAFVVPDFQGRYNLAAGAWGGTFGAFEGTDIIGIIPDAPGFGFDLTETSLEDAMRCMAEMREIEAKMAIALDELRQRAQERALHKHFTPRLWL